MNKKAYIITSPPSTGNRMMVRAIESTMDFGRGGHSYVEENSYDYVSKFISFKDKINPITLNEKLQDAPDQFVYVASVPAGNVYPPIGEIIKTITKNNYIAWPIVMHRHRDYVVKSMVARHHTKTEHEAVTLLTNSYDYIFMELAKARAYAYIIKYEVFVTDEHYRDYILRKMLDLPDTAHMDFFNANDRY